VGLRVGGNEVALAPVLLAELDTASGGDGVLVLPLGGVSGVVVLSGSSLGLSLSCTLALASYGTLDLVLASEAVAA